MPSPGSGGLPEAKPGGSTGNITGWPAPRAHQAGYGMVEAMLKPVAPVLLSYGPFSKRSGVVGKLERNRNTTPPDTESRGSCEAGRWLRQVEMRFCFCASLFLLKDNRGPKSNDHYHELVNPQTSPLQSSEGGQKRSTCAIYSRERNYRKIMRAKSAASSPSLSGDDQLRAANCGRRRRAQSDSRPCRRSVGPDKKALPPSRIVTRTLTEIDGRTHRRPTKPFSLEGRGRRGCREGKDKKEGEQFVQYGSANRRKAESRVFRPRNAGPRATLLNKADDYFVQLLPS